MRLENWYFIYFVSGKPQQCCGEVYGNEKFEDGKFVKTSKIIEVGKNFIKTRNSTYELGKKSYIQENYKPVTSNFKLLKRGADAIHKLGNIKRDSYDAELIAVHKEEEDFYIGNYVEGFGFIDVKFKKSDCRNPTQEELELIDDGKLELIKF